MQSDLLVSDKPICRLIRGAVNNQFSASGRTYRCITAPRSPYKLASKNGGSRYSTYQGCRVDFALFKAIRISEKCGSAISQCKPSWQTKARRSKSLSMVVMQYSRLGPWCTHLGPVTGPAPILDQLGTNAIDLGGEF